ncbi:copper homeostasis protein CutC [Kineosporia babensis]|uniref:PF03932 family protein CutC n=1 Tax=Kineosporia babensis TaxID=499548 RepID=A0A9X1NGX4_9ACTN|nr:copper homeostasis protein CutC [Kineosporia babensis]MCD5313943.1 copper homeostasis protein CutC [Kineosporia babensis]
MQLEIAVTGVAGARIAAQQGADRVELCTALELGGLTPSAAMVDAVVAIGLPVHVLIRSRPGNFVYTPDEVAVQAADISRMMDAGVAGVVIGALTSDHVVDEAVLSHWVGAVSGRVEVTFHRAVDQAADPVAAARCLADAGVARVLSSGGAARAGEGVAVLEQMRQAAPGLGITAGGGVQIADFPALRSAGVEGVHLSAKKIVHPAHTGSRVALGVADDASHWETDPDLVVAARAAI